MDNLLSYQVTLKNRNISLKVNSDQTIYEAALKAGVQLPIGCNYGGCITCAAKLVAGKVRQPGASALNRRQSKAGFILLCVAKPKTDCHFLMLSLPIRDVIDGDDSRSTSARTTSLRA